MRRSPAALQAERAARLADAARWTQAARVALARGLVEAASAALAAAGRALAGLRATYQDHQR